MLDHHVYDTIIKTSNLQNWSHWWRHKYSRKLKILNPISSPHYFMNLAQEQVYFGKLLSASVYTSMFNTVRSRDSVTSLLVRRKRRMLKRVCLTLTYIIIIMSQVAVPLSPFDQQNVSRWSQGEISVTLVVSQKFKNLEKSQIDGVKIFRWC